MLSRRGFLATAAATAVVTPVCPVVAQNLDEVAEYHASELAKAMRQLHPSEKPYRYMIDRKYGQVVVSSGLKRGTIV